MNVRRQRMLESVTILASAAAAGACGGGNGTGGAVSAMDGGAEASTGWRFCCSLPPQPNFCSDFDQGPGSLSAWVIETTNAAGGTPDAGSVTIDPSTFHSPPASLDVRTHPATDGGVDLPQARGFKDLRASGGHITLAFDVLLPAGGLGAVVADIGFAHATASDDVQLLLQSQGIAQSIPVDGGGVNEARFLRFDAGV